MSLSEDLEDVRGEWLIIHLMPPTMTIHNPTIVPSVFPVVCYMVGRPGSVRGRLEVTLLTSLGGVLEPMVGKSHRGGLPSHSTD